jgi:hypothetical protein
MADLPTIAAPAHTRAGGNIVIEAPVSPGATLLVGDDRVGYLTSIGDHGILHQCAEIGRYCSVAAVCHIGAQSHPTDWLSTHHFSTRPIPGIRSPPPAALGSSSRHGSVTTFGSAPMW